MTIQYHLDTANKLIVYYLPRSTQRDDLLAFIDEVAQVPGIDSYSDLGVLDGVNEQLDGNDRSPNPFKSISERINMHFGRGGEFRSAYLVDSDVDYGLLRMYSTYRGREHDQFNIFFKTDEALQWLGVDASDVETLANIIEKWRQPDA